jgi:hypothetical protein
MRFVFESAVAFNAQFAAANQAPALTIPDASESALEWLGRLRLLIGVPFEYLVPDDGLLRPETIRFFHVDRNWTDAAVDGAIAAGAYGTRDRVTLHQRHPAVRQAVDAAERRQRVGGDNVTGTSSVTATLSGFLLRSRAVSGWPGMHVRGWRGSRRLVIMRMERLAPAVLLVIFDDIPDRMEIEEPRQGIQFGVRAPRGGEPAGSWWVDLRSPATGLEAPGAPKERVPFRAGSAGVLHLTELRRRLTANHPTVVGPTLTSAEMALQLLRYPYRQRFGPAPGGTLGDVLTTTYSIEKLQGWLVVKQDG